MLPADLPRYLNHMHGLNFTIRNALPIWKNKTERAGFLKLECGSARAWIRLATPLMVRAGRRSTIV
jgi:hypothetical protein